MDKKPAAPHQAKRPKGRPRVRPEDRQIGTSISASSEFWRWAHGQSTRYGQSISSFILAPHLPAFRAMTTEQVKGLGFKPDAPYPTNQPPVEPLPAAPAIAQPIDPREPRDAANPCSDCGNMKCEPGAEPWYSCGAPTNPDRWTP